MDATEKKARELVRLMATGESLVPSIQEACIAAGLKPTKGLAVGLIQLAAGLLHPSGVTRDEFGKLALLAFISWTPAANQKGGDA